jgi:hypothetical protein
MTFVSAKVRRYERQDGGQLDVVIGALLDEVTAEAQRADPEARPRRVM